MTVSQPIDPIRQIDLFSALQSSTEGLDTEFKSARGGMPGSFWESYSAMANSQGGTIVLGVVEKPTRLVWEGVPDATQLCTVCSGAQPHDWHLPPCGRGRLPLLTKLIARRRDRAAFHRYRAHLRSWRTW